MEKLFEKSRRVPRIGKRALPEIEQKVLDYALQFPTHGPARVADELKKSDIQISVGGFKSIWQRHNLTVNPLRLKRLEKWAAPGSFIPHTAEPPWRCA